MTDVPQNSFKKISAAVAEEVLAHYEVDAPLAECLAQSPELGQLAPEEFVAQVQAKGLLSDLIKFLAHALPRREAVWWACAAARKVSCLEPQAARPALKAAEKWVKAPTEAHRRNAENNARKTKFEFASSWAAQAAFWAKGSMTGANEPPVAVPKYLYAQAVNGAMALAVGQAQAAAVEQEQLPVVTEQDLIAMALCLARGEALAV